MLRAGALWWLLSISVMLLVGPADASEPKEYDKDVNYDESRLPAYDLPPLLMSAEGKQITTAEEWFTIRRPQIVSPFSNLIYGRVPAPAQPIKTAYEVVREDPSFMGGQATRKDVRRTLTTLELQ